MKEEIKENSKGVDIHFEIAIKHALYCLSDLMDNSTSGLYAIRNTIVDSFIKPYANLIQYACNAENMHYHKIIYAIEFMIERLEINKLQLEDVINRLTIVKDFYEDGVSYVNKV
jgi:hypothetical protein